VHTEVRARRRSGDAVALFEAQYGEAPLQSAGLANFCGVDANHFATPES